MQEVKLGIGDACFWSGHEYVISGSSSTELWVLFSPNSNWSAKVVRKKDVEPLVQSVFKIGDRVQSAHTFTGKVTGYEPESNRAVCMSDKTEYYRDLLGPGSGIRGRWAYKISELQRVPELILWAE